MQEMLTKPERATILKTRARRLQFFVETHNGRPNRLIEKEAYLVLEAHQSRSRAIWRYIRYALKEWRDVNRFRFELTALVFWFERVKGLERGAAIDQAHKTLEARILTSMKGADHADSD